MVMQLDPPIRVRRVPAIDPPFDDEAMPRPWADTGQLAVPWPKLVRAAACEPVPEVSRPVPPEALAGASDEARGAARQFLHRSLEVLNGYRPIGHLRPLSGLLETPQILRGVGSALSRIGVLRRTAGLPIAAGRRPLAPAGRVQPRRLRVCEPRPGVAEAAAVLATAGRSWAFAFRLELSHGRWLATAVTVV